jgi:hypothetical protein
MAYDPIRQVVVLHGGRLWGTADNQTWEWNGVGWTQRTPPVAPPIRAYPAFAFDPNRAALVLTGGSWTSMFTDTWTWDGVVWTQLVTQPSVWPRNVGAFTVDPARNELMLFGGSVFLNTASAARRDAQWLRTSVTTPQTGSVGASCAAGTPPRLSSPVPFVGNLDFSVDLLDANAQSVCCVGFAPFVQAQPVGPCTLQLGGGTVLLAAITNAHGFARFALPLPPTAGLIGAQLVAQGAVYSGSGPLFGFDLTAARTMLLGD